MIFKHSLLDAYMTLSGTYVQHLAMLITILAVLPSAAQQEKDLMDWLIKEHEQEIVKNFYRNCLVTHSTSAFILLVKEWRFT